MSFLAPIALGLASAAAPAIGKELGDLGGKGIRALRKKVGFKRGGTINPKGIKKALHKATVKRTGTRVVKKNELVIPKRLATAIKKVARRGPTVIKRKRK